MNLDDDINRTQGCANRNGHRSGQSANAAIAEIAKAVRLHRQLAVESKADLQAALPVLSETLSHHSGQSAKVAAILQSVWAGELSDNLAGLDGRVAQAVIAMIAARAYHGGDADALLAPLIHRTPNGCANRNGGDADALLRPLQPEGRQS